MRTRLHPVRRGTHRAPAADDEKSECDGTCPSSLTEEGERETHEVVNGKSVPNESRKYLADSTSIDTKTLYTDGSESLKKVREEHLDSETTTPSGHGDPVPV